MSVMARVGRMVDWRAVAAADYAVPENEDLPALVDELARMLTSDDPVVRDELGYSILATWIARDLLPPDQLDLLGDQMAKRFTADEIQTRTFAPLILDSVVSKGRFSQVWFDAFAAWYPNEDDLRGFDPRLGWLHAVAHGADLLGAFGRCPQVRPELVLAVASERLTRPAAEVWRDHEDDRLGYAIALTLTRRELTEWTAVRWLDAVADDWARRGHGPPAAEVSNAVHTLRMVYVLATTGVRPSGERLPVLLSHEATVRRRLLDVLHGVSPYMW